MNMNEKTYIITDKKYNIIRVGTSKNPYSHLKTIQKSNGTGSSFGLFICMGKREIY